MKWNEVPTFSIFTAQGGGGGPLDFELGRGSRRTLGLKNGFWAKIGAKELQFERYFWGKAEIRSKLALGVAKLDKFAIVLIKNQEF